VIDAGHFDGGDRVGDFEGFDRGFDLLNHRVESPTLVLHRGRFDQHFAVVVTDHPSRANLGTVNRNDGEVLGSGFLDSRLNDTTGLADVSGLPMYRVRVDLAGLRRGFWVAVAMGKFLD